MRKNTILLLALLGGLLASCFKDDEVTFNDYCYVSNVSLGALKKVNKVAGTDSTYITTYSGSLFQMTIDQRTDTIQNRDSLLYGTDLSALLVTISFDGATLLYRPADADSTDEWTAYNSKDSMDLRKPLHLLAVANDGASNRLYTLKVNVHQQEGDSLYWQRRDSNVVALEGLEGMRALAYNGKLCVYGRMADGVYVSSRALNAADGQWTREKLETLPNTAEPNTVCAMAGMLYMGTSDGMLYSSGDGLEWQYSSTIAQDARLAGAGKSCLYAVASRLMFRSVDGKTWEQENLDDDSSNLPDTCLHMLCFQHNDGSERVVLTGFRSQENASAKADTAAVVWNKTWSKNESETDANWIYFTQTWDNTWLCPRLSDLTVMAYDGKCMAFGGEPAFAGSAHQSMDALYFSRDYGITWKPDYELHLPKELKGVSGPLAGTVDDDKYIWIIANRQVWRGRLNRLGFLRQ